MGLVFKQALHDQLGCWPLAYIPYGGADIGEVLAVAHAVGDGDDSAFHDAWTAAAERFGAQAEAALAANRRDNARELLLRASCFHATAYHPLFGEPVDERLLSGYRKQIAAFDQAMSLSSTPVTQQRIPFGATTLPAYLIPAERFPDEKRPLLILTNGYDATVTDLYFASAVAASRRGYHCLLFDGPGQGEMLFEQGMHLRPDWENVVRAVVDFALHQPIVDPQRIALSGWSLGGYLAPRAASGEHRLAACIADPGQWSVAEGFRAAAIRLGASPDEVRDMGRIDDTLLARMEELVANDRQLTWSVVQRGFWVNGTNNLRDYLSSVEMFTMEGRAESIRCPTLLTLAERDPLTRSTRTLFDRLTCPKELIRFAAAEGAGEHCEMMNRSLLNRRVLDWLDGVLGG
jgi:pimeloyl-ACP methyl ester carboxylesterase